MEEMCLFDWAARSLSARTGKYRVVPREKVPIATRKRCVPCTTLGRMILAAADQNASRKWRVAASIPRPIPAHESVLLEASENAPCRITPRTCQRCAGMIAPSLTDLPKNNTGDIVFQYY
jgi:hypothetical protein